MTTQAGNYMIADFDDNMKFKPIKAGFETGSSYVSIDKEFNTLQECLDFCDTRNYGMHHDECFFPLPRTQGFKLKYHSSWSSLMPVIEKISKIEIYEYEDGTPDTAYPRTFGMIDEDGNFMFRFNGHTLFSGETLIEAAWNAVVDFIENNNSPKQ